MTFEFYEVGGCVRDELLNIPTKDIDYSVVPPVGVFTSVEDAFDAMEAHLISLGFTPVKNTKLDCEPHQFLTIRAKVADDSPLKKRTNFADFVLARTDGPYSDGRRPDWVKPGTLEDDIFRRDFTVNALVRTVNGEIIDLVGGLSDLENRILRFVGNPMTRISEDGLRVARALRFKITKGLTIVPEHWEVLTSEFAAEMLSKVSVERTREELIKMFRFDTLSTLRLLGSLPEFFQEAIFHDGLRLDATLKQ